MVENTATSLHNVNTEIDRYIIWPGQVGTCLSLPYFVDQIFWYSLRFQWRTEDVEIPHFTLNVEDGWRKRGCNWLYNISVILPLFVA